MGKKTINLKETYVEIEKLIKPMEVPFNRKQDLNPAKINWLYKNLKVKNETHKNYPKTMEILEELQ